MRFLTKTLAIVGVLAQVPAIAQECACGAPCDLLLEADIDGVESVTACNTVTVIGVEVLSTGNAEIQVGALASFFNGFTVADGGALSVVIDSLLGCDPMIDVDNDGVDQCLDCDDTDENNWVSCGSCVDGEGDSAWVGCDAYVTLIGPDCDDTDSNRRPGVVETCNAIDDNCNGLVDECLVCTAPSALEAAACPFCPELPSSETLP